jgi:hypothetical protein
MVVVQGVDVDGLDELEHYLRTARILDVGAFPDPDIPAPGAHPSFRFILEGGVGALAKPAHTIGEGDAVVRYEAAAWVLARQLGWTDLVATSVLRGTDVFPGVEEEVTTSLQILWPGFELDADMGQFSDEDIWRAAIFDVLVLHTDRTHNWGAVPGHGEKRLKLIDHGYAFREWPGREFASSFANAKAGQEIPDDLAELLDDFLGRAETDDGLEELLGEDVLEELVARGRTLVEDRTLNRP